MSKLKITATEGIDTPVTIEQTSKYHYRVTYHKHVREGLTFTKGMEEFANCVGHSRECAGFNVYKVSELN